LFGRDLAKQSVVENRPEKQGARVFRELFQEGGSLGGMSREKRKKIFMLCGV